MREDDLQLTTFQYQVRHESIENFKFGEYVFLKSNPEIILRVVGFYQENVAVIKENKLLVFPPQCLLQYNLAGLLQTKNFKISLN